MERKDETRKLEMKRDVGERKMKVLEERQQCRLGRSGKQVLV